MSETTTQTGLEPDKADRTNVSLPRWAVRLTLGLCPVFALTIAGLALMILSGAGPSGFGLVLFAIFWLGATGYCLWSAVMVLLYLRQETSLSNSARFRLGGAAAIILLTVAVLCMIVLLAS